MGKLAYVNKLHGSWRVLVDLCDCKIITPLFLGIGYNVIFICSHPSLKEGAAWEGSLGDVALGQVKNKLSADHRCS